MRKTFILIVVLIALAIVAYLLAKNKAAAPGLDSGEQVFCTMDAMQCPDGSYVGRTGPNCEFSPCPGQ
ncbi:MAG: hypothetical protein A3J09_00720 [Candidatus Zambryskibacteria bacterium RIFCSPLOWO2_02_FULL_51_21]|uniref:Uncharacterized protein n=1 Tax=Candidatus Zambryskibacteria bacterium RIFCSPHIGHO2_02_FULL_43_37 TaxID=1802749 RepID=A0A1G2THE0_9BACT|nr:MAG: hypothetical protein A2723_00715 [Candidatus Zambryskibacteria bacterium RIFCSPHIGHO2_01_FULL_52_18]OHA96724.1 MAG: hypothetical protein A3D49_02680 [Candidatus Zambryskibacteria bacterium RIFCSPHIGHO2_02_FULL_43_37]OHB07417.1 MAG: hypothetical protein A2944_01755 [Candidatus Zambryskibacteria bacterium RIFCSPLOWO2_01_FULL_52_12]OHB11079.1 MAG: hypothetical protein A3J09_00720 [Candidatus Zambryskibacteria bacterium RIFCSPLOWO2_02_FULL_51_21]